MTLFPTLFAVACGGAGGALARYAMTVALVPSLYRDTFWATLTINLIGCFAIGVVGALIAHHKPHAVWSLLLMTGFLGSFTTYSTFTLDALSLIQKGQYGVALTHISAHLFGGMALCVVGLAVAQHLIRAQH